MTRGNFSRNTGHYSLLILRIGLGVDMAMHGLVRIPKLGRFADKMVGDFSATILPDFFVRGFAFALPIVELVIGILLFMGGRFLALGGLAGGLTMAALIFGSALREEWGAVSIQMIHILAFYFLLKEQER